ncbi:LuxR C-terminal-related transcriptional regulator, partial [Saezia sanguinis]
PRTVEKHLASIFRKLDVSSRTAAARYACDRDIG